MNRVAQWFRDQFTLPERQEDEEPVPERVSDPTPPLPAVVTVCGKCGSLRGTGWRYRFRKANAYTPVTVRHGDIFWSVPTQVCSRPEHIEVTCVCGHRWLELTAEAIHGKVGQDFWPFPTFMQAWEWMRTTGGYDESVPLGAAPHIVAHAQLRVDGSEEGQALFEAAFAVLKAAFAVLKAAFAVLKDAGVLT